MGGHWGAATGFTWSKGSPGAGVGLGAPGRGQFASEAMQEPTGMGCLPSQTWGGGCRTVSAVGQAGEFALSFVFW